MPICALTVPHPTHLPANVSGKLTEDVPSPWAPATQAADSEVPGSWLLPDPALAIVIMEGVKQLIEKSHTPPPPVTPSNQ